MVNECTFTEETVQQVAEEPRSTTLTEFFKLCQQDPYAKTLLYSQVPQYYTWNNKCWKRRKMGNAVNGWPDIRQSDALGRVYTIHPKNFECFCLRILLHVVTGPTNFEYLRSLEGVTYHTYREACLERGLLQDDRLGIKLSLKQQPQNIQLNYATFLQSCFYPVKYQILCSFGLLIEKT